MPCNFGLRTLAHAVKEGVKAAGGVPMEVNTVAISDGITMGTEGMKTSLVSREVIADSVELVGRGHMFDAVIGLGACDKTLPGSLDRAGAAQHPRFPDLRRHDPARRVNQRRRRRRSAPSTRRSARFMAGRISRRRPQGDRGPRLPDSRRLRRSVHRQHDGDGDGVHRSLAARHRLAAGRFVRAAGGRRRHEGQRRQPAQDGDRAQAPAS